MQHTKENMTKNTSSTKKYSKTYVLAENLTVCDTFAMPK